MSSELKGVLVALLTSRKVWLAVIGAGMALAAFISGQIGAEVLVDAIVALMGIVIFSIAGEDMAWKFNLSRNASEPEDK